jgi:hypothetical protein
MATTSTISSLGLSGLASDAIVDLLVKGKPIARGEVAVIDVEFGQPVTEVVTGHATAPEPEPPAPAPAPAVRPVAAEA